jgi:hypothetical protein
VEEQRRSIHDVFGRQRPEQMGTTRAPAIRGSWRPPTAPSTSLVSRSPRRTSGTCRRFSAARRYKAGQRVGRARGGGRGGLEESWKRGRGGFSARFSCRRGQKDFGFRRRRGFRREALREGNGANQRISNAECAGSPALPREDRRQHDSARSDEGLSVIRGPKAEAVRERQHPLSIRNDGQYPSACRIESGGNWHFTSATRWPSRRERRDLFLRVQVVPALGAARAVDLTRYGHLLARSFREPRCGLATCDRSGATRASFTCNGTTKKKCPCAA